jgi:ATP-dependent helicase HrpB
VNSLPIDQLLPDLRDALVQRNGVVLQAPPGAGKTTRVPLALLDSDWLAGRRILVLEPRRLAARATARFMAHSLAEALGATVGYRVHLETRVGVHTRIEVVTEGVLVRMLQSDPALESVGLVIFDEFHERSLQADLALALCLDVQAGLREDLRLLVMSATLDGAAVAGLLGGAPLLTSAGRSHAVATRYRPVRSSFARAPRGFCEEVARAVLAALQQEPGSLLVFLPGAAEIRRVQAALSAAALGPEVVLAPLYGQLTASEQDAAIAPAPAGRRKVVLATAIAETSLTIDGIRVVVDSGLTRQSRFEPNSGLSRLVTLPVSRASADQRRGRAGRLEPGVCYRLWPESLHLLAQDTPEILAADLCPLVLELASWGVPEVSQLRWIDTPPQAHVAQATDLLRRLGALDPEGRISAHGRRMLAVAAHPRLAHMMLRAAETGHALLACELAALLGERDPLAREFGDDADIVLRLEWLRGQGGYASTRPGLRKRLHDSVRQLQRQLGAAAASTEEGELSVAGTLLSLAFPDRIGQRRPGADNRFLLSSGRGAFFSQAQPLAAQDYLVAAHLGDGREARIHLAAAVRPEHLLEMQRDLAREHCFVSWNGEAAAVQARCQLRLGELVLRDAPWHEADETMVQAAMLEGIRRAGVDCLPWNDAARQLRERVMFLHRLAPAEWPDLSDAALLDAAERWLLPWLQGVTRLAQLKRLDLHALLVAQLSWPQQRQLDELAPTHLQVPSGSRVRLDYAHPVPVLAVRLQEMFGLLDTPRVAGGRVPVLLHLLSPARRPVQITSDLAGFWSGAYHQVRKELKGRYPKHHWPDAPLQAQATRHTRPKH